MVHNLNTLVLLLLAIELSICRQMNTNKKSLLIPVNSTSKELYSALTNLKPLFITQKRIKDYLEKYINKEEERLDTIKRFVRICKQEHEKSKQDIPAYMGHPLNVFKLAKRLTTDLALIEKSLKNTTVYDKDVKYPGHEDLTLAARAITRIQKVYNLTVQDISEGIILRTNSSIIMSSDDCYELGRVLYLDKDLTNGLAWLQEAYTKYKDMTPADREMLPYNGAKIKEFIDKINIEIEDNKLLEKLYPARKGPDWEFKQDKKRMNERYEALCRGEPKIPDNFSKKLKCWYSTKHHPFLKYAPIKVEQLFIQPDILLFHKVLFDTEIEDLKYLYKRRLRRSREHNFIPITKNMTISGKESPTVGKIIRRIMDMTGLSADCDKDLLVVKYGMAGELEEKDDDYERKQFATVLFHLSNVEQGGATVFTDIGVTVSPITGSALFWWDLLPSRVVDITTRYATCPVVRGTKWIAKKWFHENDKRERTKKTRQSKGSKKTLKLRKT